MLDPKKKYQLGPRKDDYGNTDESVSLNIILGACDDFLNEKTQLEYIANCRGFELDLSPNAILK